MATSSPPAQRRRRLLTAAVAGPAALAGLWWHKRESGTPDGGATPPLANGLPANFWAMQFPQPSGPPLALASLRGKALVINFWATWCPPCLREMPALSRFQNEFADRNWQVLGLAVDSAAPVVAYLAQNPVTYPIALAGLEGIDLSRLWGNTSGGLPFSVVLDKIGQVAHTHLGEARFEQMAAWAAPR